MAPNSNDSREPFLQLIESQSRINNRFENVQRLDPKGGNGHFSLIFTANDLSTGQEIILKFFNPGFFGELDRLARFEREGEILLKLKGKQNILQCIDGMCKVSIDLTTSSGATIPMNFPFIPLEKAKSSIEQFIYSGSGSPEMSLIYFREMCKAVARIHSLRVCHRDLKPGNFLLFPGDEVKLGDFGTAKFLDGSMPDIKLSYRLPLGELSYIAPELFCQLGITGDCAISADIFSLGAILFEMFSQAVLINYIYTQDFIVNMVKLRNYLLASPEKFRVDYYLSAVDGIAPLAIFPEISSFNDFVPKCIKEHLNCLYKSLTQINMAKRLHDFQTIFRRIDICLLTLRNEKKYKKWLRKKREKKSFELSKIMRRERDA